MVRSVAEPLRIGVYGGMFDPVHNGHLRVALDVMEAGRLDQVRFVPCHRPTHRRPAVASATVRVQLLEEACATQPGFLVDDREVSRDTPSWTLDTLRELRRDFPDAHLHLLLGEDNFHGLPGWHRWLELTDHAHIVVMPRPGTRKPCAPLLGQWLAGREADDWQTLGRRRAGGVLFQTVTQLDISSSDLRQRLAQGRSPRFLVPDRVCDTIGRDSLYAGDA